MAEFLLKHYFYCTTPLRRIVISVYSCIQCMCVLDIQGQVQVAPGPGECCKCVPVIVCKYQHCYILIYLYSVNDGLATSGIKISVLQLFILYLKPSSVKVSLDF